MINSIMKIYRLYSISAMTSATAIFLWYIITASTNNWVTFAVFNHYDEGPTELVVALTSFPGVIWIIIRTIKHELST